MDNDIYVNYTKKTIKQFLKLKNIKNFFEFLDISIFKTTKNDLIFNFIEFQLKLILIFK